MIYLYLFGTCFHFIYVFMIIGNIKMLSQQLQQLTSRIELEKQKGDMLESICLTLTTEG